MEYLIPLRQIVACADRGEPRALYLLNKNEIKATLFFDDVQNAINMKDLKSKQEYLNLNKNFVSNG